MTRTAGLAFTVFAITVIAGCGAGVADDQVSGPTVQPLDAEPTPEMSLRKAVAEGDLDLVATLLEQGVSTGLVEDGGELLHRATAEGRSFVVTVLLEAGFADEFGAPEKCSLVIEAVKSGSAEVLESVLAVTREALDECDDEVLILAAIQTGSDEMLESMIGAGVTPGGGTVEDMPWIVFAGGGHPVLLRHLIDGGADLNVQDGTGRTAIFRACWAGDVTCVKLLLDAGADPELETESGTSPIEAAVAGGHGDAYLALAEAGVKLDKALVPEGLLSFVKSGHVAAAQAMLDKGAKINALYGDKQTAIYHAIDAQQAAMVEYLVEHGASTELRDQAGWKPIHFAAFRGYTQMVMVLIEVGADIDGKAGDGKTALMHAVTQGHTELTEKLIELGADLDHQDKEGKTALMHAASARHAQGVQALLEAGADKTLLSDTGKDALFYASKESAAPVDPDIVALLE